MTRSLNRHPTLTRSILDLRFHVALVPIVVTWFLEAPLGYRVDARYYAIVALNTLAGYWLNILTDRAEDRGNRRASEATAERPILLGSGAASCFLLSFLLALPAGWKFVLFGFLLNLAGGLYGARLRLPGRDFRIKSVLLLKNIYAALFWSAALLLGPFVYTGQAPPPALPWVTLSVFFTAWYVELLWDLRDIEGDSAAGVRTLPARFGAGASVVLLYLLSLASAAAMALAAWRVDPDQPWRTALVLAAATLLFTLIFRLAADRERLSHLYLALVGVVLVTSKGLA